MDTEIIRGRIWLTVSWEACGKGRIWSLASLNQLSTHWLQEAWVSFSVLENYPFHKYKFKQYLFSNCLLHKTQIIAQNCIHTPFLRLQRSSQQHWLSSLHSSNRKQSPTQTKQTTNKPEKPRDENILGYEQCLSRIPELLKNKDLPYTETPCLTHLAPACCCLIYPPVFAFIFMLSLCLVLCHG